MTRPSSWPVVPVVAVLVAATLSLLPGSAHAVDPPQHTIDVAGAGVGMYPVFDPSVTRYAVTTTDATGGEVEVYASTDDPDGVVRVNGRRLTGPSTTVTGLEPGEEISVLVDDAGGAAAYSLVHLPAGFPTLEVTARGPGRAPGLVGLTLTEWNEPTPSFEAVVDDNGVPVHVLTSRSLDLKRQDTGSLSVFRTLPGDTEPSFVLLDERLDIVSAHQTVGLEDTDDHDGMVLPNGNLLLLAYEVDTAADPDLTHAVIQEVTPGGRVVFEWSSEGVLDDSVHSPDFFGKPHDYAHVNSVQLTADGHLLASFRHFSSVLKIARSAGDGYAAGDVIWRLGGKFSDFTFVDDPHPGGPCAQHTAYELPGGTILLYDNGSGGITPNMCIDPADRTGAPVARASTRVTEYALDEDTGTATLVWSWAPPGRYAFFAGSAQRLPGGNTLTGWAAERTSLATEVSPAGEVVWQLRDVDAGVDGSPFYSTYRAAKLDLPDAIAPQVSVDAPADGAVVEVGAAVPVEVTCTDRGGSTLRTCTAPAALDTGSAGTRALVVRARDGAGNVTRVRRSYTVAPPHRPDGLIRRVRGAPWRGDDVYGGRRGQTVTRGLPAPGRRATVRVRWENDGAHSDRVAITGRGSGGGLRVTYRRGGEDVTAEVVRGALRSRVLEPGERFAMTVQVRRTRRARPGTARIFWMTGTSVGDPGAADTVALRARVPR